MIMIEQLQNQGNQLQSVKGSIFNKEGKKIIEDILSVWDDEHCIYICHPNHIFDGVKPITKDVRNIKCINWDDIDIKKCLELMIIKFLFFLIVLMRSDMFIVV